MESVGRQSIVKEHKWHFLAAGLIAASIAITNFVGFGDVSYSKAALETAYIGNEITPIAEQATTTPEITWPAELDKEAYDAKLLSLAWYKEPSPVTEIVTDADGSTSTVTKIIDNKVYSDDTNVTVTGKRWPTAAPYPHGGVIVPEHRILAYYGNFYSRYMGILGEYSEEEVLRRLAEQQKEWEAADPDTPVIPAIEYIAMVAQAEAGADGMYRAVMPDEHMQKAIRMARQINGIMIFDLQIGLSTLDRELPKFRTYLEEPDVHLALDPEFAMHNGNPPGTVIGSFDADDINYAIDYLSEIVREKQLPPKVLIVHRFTQNMVTRAELIKPTPEVQVIMVMDGWGSKDLKRGTYSQVIEPEPVQFAGLKIFYKNDLKPPSTGIFTATEALQLNPKPIFIQYQ